VLFKTLATEAVIPVKTLPPTYTFPEIERSPEITGLPWIANESPSIPDEFRMSVFPTDETSVAAEKDKVFTSPFKVETTFTVTAGAAVTAPVKVEDPATERSPAAFTSVRFKAPVRLKLLTCIGCVVIIWDA
jgi:hypothetical protein